MTIDEEIIGTLIRVAVCQPFAPSMRAAS